MAQLSDQPWEISGFIQRNWKPLFIPSALFLALSAIATTLYIQPVLLSSTCIGSIASTLPFWWLIPVTGLILAAAMFATQCLSLISKDKAIVALDYAAEHWSKDFESMESNLDKKSTPTLKYAFDRLRPVYRDLPENSATKNRYKNFVTLTLFAKANQADDADIKELLSQETASLSKK